MAVTTQRGLDLRFQQFDKWYVLGKGRQTRHGQFWICQCACGRQAELHEAALTEGRAQSCGCDYVDRSGRRYPITDYTGWQIGERLVLERVLKPSGKTRVGLWYRVRCRCGQEESLSLSLVLGRQASSCKTCAGDQRVSVQTRRWYGAWWVIRRVESTGHRQAMFLCHCRLCGREKAVSALTLATGRSNWLFRASVGGSNHAEKPCKGHESS